MILPDGQKQLVVWFQEIVDRCRSSAAARAAKARSERQWVFTGSPDGNTSLLNKLYSHNERLSSYLFSPNDLRVQMDFTHNYGKDVLDKAEVAAKVVTREIQRRDIDMQFSQGVRISLDHGVCIPKLMYGNGGAICKLLMPWNIGVYREDRETLGEQEAIVETNIITPFDLWRRISHLPNAQELFRRALSYAKRKQAGDDADTYFHQVLLAGTAPVVQTDPPFVQQPGGLVEVTADPMGSQMSPAVTQEMLVFHEGWVIDDERQDYTTIQMVEPDILIAPRFKRTNMFVPEYLPYGLIRTNSMAPYFWGRSEIADLMKLQHLLRDRLDDIKKIMSMQYDRLLAFVGESGMTDELYDQFRSAGWVTLGAGADVKDITPKVPDQAFADVHDIINMMDEVSGFVPVLKGQGEPGVRADSHAETLMRTASPRLRDRALIVERQFSDFADKLFQLMAAKEPKAFWVDDSENSEFLLSQLPDDYRITVDSHSTSPIYEQDHKDVAAFLAKAGAVDGQTLLELLPVPNRDLLIARYKLLVQAKAQQEQQMLKEAEQNPQAFKALKSIQGGKK
jgi:hypothetical protein